MNRSHLPILNAPAALLRDFARERRQNAFYAFSARRNRDFTQIAMLLLVTTFASGATSIFKVASFTEGGLVLWLFMRWGIMEFLLAWLAADHCFTTLGRARHTGLLQELRLTTMTPREIAAGLAHSTALFLLLSVVLWNIAECFIALPAGRTFNWEDHRAGLTLWQYAIPVMLALNGAATVFLASAIATREAARPDASTATWARSLGRMAWRVALILVPTGILALVAPVLTMAASDLWPPSYQWAEVLFTDHKRILLWLIPLAIVPPLVKCAWALRELDAAGTALDAEGSDAPGRYYRPAFDQDRFAPKEGEA